MSKQKIRIRLKAFDYKLIDQSAAEIVDTAKVEKGNFTFINLVRTVLLLLSEHRKGNNELSRIKIDSDFKSAKYAFG